MSNFYETRKTHFDSLTLYTVEMYVFLDSDHNTDHDRNTQLGMIILLVDDSNHYHFLHCFSTKS